MLGVLYSYPALPDPLNVNMKIRVTAPQPHKKELKMEAR